LIGRARDVVSLNRDLDDALAFYHAEEITISNRDPAFGWLFKHLKQRDHHDPDYQQKNKVFAVLVQFNVTPFTNCREPITSQKMRKQGAASAIEENKQELGSTLRASL